MWGVCRFAASSNKLNDTNRPGAGLRGSPRLAPGHAPARAYQTLALPKRLIEGGRVFKHPAIETGIVNLNTARLHHFS